MGTIEFAEDYRKIGLYCRVDVGIDPYGIFETDAYGITKISPEDSLFRGDFASFYDCKILVVSGSGSNHLFLPKRMIASPTSTVSKIVGIASTGILTQPWLPPLT